MLLLELLMLTSHFWVHYNLSRFSDSQMTCFHISATIRPSTPGPTISRSLCPTLSNERAPIPMASDIPMITQRRKMNNHTKTKRDSVNRVNFARSNFPERMGKNKYNIANWMRHQWSTLGGWQVYRWKMRRRQQTSRRGGAAGRHGHSGFERGEGQKGWRRWRRQVQ